MSSPAKPKITDGYKGTKAKVMSSKIYQDASYFNEICPESQSVQGTHFTFKEVEAQRG